MKRILVPVVASLMLLGCGAPKQSDTDLIADFYAHILSNKPVEDAYIESVLSKELLATLWEADYIDTLGLSHGGTGRPVQRIRRKSDRASWRRLVPCHLFGHGPFRHNGHPGERRKNLCL